MASLAKVDQALGGGKGGPFHSVIDCPQSAGALNRRAHGGTLLRQRVLEPEAAATELISPVQESQRPCFRPPGEETLADLTRELRQIGLTKEEEKLT